LQVGKPRAALRSALDACEPLRELAPDVVDEMFLQMEQRRYDAGEHLIHQGDPGDCLLVLVEGSARIVVRGRAEALDEIGRFSAGDVVGEMALVTREPRSADVVAESRLSALVLPAHDFHDIAGRHLELGMVLTRLIGDRLGRTTRDGLGDKVVNGYRILRRIGRGGMSIVYEAERTGTCERLALKMMSHRLVYEPGAMTRFRREADLVRSFRHDNIARVHERFSAYNTEFLVMELCDGSDLAELVRRNGATDEGIARTLLGQIAGALDYVHGRNVIHRDVKPGNVMLLPDGVAKLMDFGVARPDYDASDETRTQPRTVVGTMRYMPPEQLAGGNVDARADIYALACLGYELLTGTPPFTGSNLVELIQQKLSFRLPPAGEIGTGVTDEMHEFLQRALRDDPAQRPDSIAPLAAWAAPTRGWGPTARRLGCRRSPKDP
jgi:CRP-like cAMP-binding protein